MSEHQSENSSVEYDLMIVAEKLAEINERQDRFFEASMMYDGFTMTSVFLEEACSHIRDLSDAIRDDEAKVEVAMLAATAVANVGALLEKRRPTNGPLESGCL